MINEIVEQEERYNKPTICFIDDNMSFSKGWITQFLTQLISKNISSDASASNFYVKHFDEEVIDLLAKAGVKVFGIAVESGSQQMQKHIRKKVDFDKVREVVKIIKSRKLHVYICWMLGFPNETLQQINSTIAFARELRAH
jgi:magnesium-protoporphyrin IX monomethyl ester (oxidative) cyclase